MLTTKEQKRQAASKAIDKLITKIEEDVKRDSGKSDPVIMILSLMIGHLAITEYETELAAIQKVH